MARKTASKGKRTSKKPASAEKKEVRRELPGLLYYAAWLTALSATTGSLFFSEILHFPPCILCWYQRILMYPFVFIVPVAIIKKDKLLPYYVLPMAGLGWLIAAYHNLLYYNIIPEAQAPCVAGISCTTKFIEWFGFITIPLLSLTAFSVIIACMFASIQYNRKNNEQRS